MKIFAMVRDSVPFALGGGALTNPLWLGPLLQSVSFLWQVGIALAGAYVLYLSAKAKRLEIKQRQKALETKP